MNFTEKVLIGGGMHFARYFITAGMAWLLFYILMRSKWSSRKIQAGFPAAAQIKREILYSVSSLLIFTAILALTITLNQLGITHIYLKFSEYSTAYFMFSVLLLILWHDTWFYWTHRLLHHRRFARFHRLHHQSHSTTPWTAFAFHPVEACIQAAFIPLILLVLPFHPLAIGIVLGWQMIFNVAGHLGYEIQPAWFHNSIGRIFNTSTHHNMHHQYSKGNYGLYFSMWDRIMRSTHPAYEDAYRAAEEKMFGTKNKANTIARVQE